MNNKTLNERINFYLGEELSKINKIDINTFTNIKTIKDLTNGKNNFDKLYDVPLKKLLIKTNNSNKKFLFQRADIIQHNEQNILTLCKNRCDGNNNSVLLRCLNFNRHWKLYYNKPKDILYKNKLTKIFWRGVTTGCSSHHSAQKWNPRYPNRFDLVKKWFNKNKNIDVGFSNVHRDWLKKEYQKYTKGRCSPEKFLKHKFILSVEGNDKDSGLNWKLNSNSLVLMPKPRVTSWLMETTLIPGFHYVLLNDDFSDLEEKFKWCKNNPNKCKKIISNANNYMKQFKNKKQEEEIEKKVINKYFNIIT